MTYCNTAAEFWYSQAEVGASIRLPSTGDTRRRQRLLVIVTSRLDQIGRTSICDTSAAPPRALRRSSLPAGPSRRATSV